MTSIAIVRTVFLRAPLVCAGLLLGGCASAKFVPYQGAQQAWPTSPGAFVETVHDVPVYRGPPPRPYDVLGYLDATTAPVRRTDVVPYAAGRAKEFGGDAVVVLSEGSEFVGTMTTGSAETTGSVTGNTFRATSNFNCNAYPMFAGRAVLLVIKFKP